MSNKIVFKEEKNDNNIDGANNKPIDNINNSKSISFSTNYNILKIITLQDGRILTYQYITKMIIKNIYINFLYIIYIMILLFVIFLLIQIMKNIWI